MPSSRATIAFALLLAAAVPCDWVASFATAQPAVAPSGPSWVLSAPVEEVIARVREQEAWLWERPSAYIRYDARTENTPESLAREEALMRRSMQGVNFDDPRVRAAQPALAAELREKVEFGWTTETLFISEEKVGFQRRKAVAHDHMATVSDLRAGATQPMFTRDANWTGQVSARVLAPLGLGRVCAVPVWWSPYRTDGESEVPGPAAFIDRGVQDRQGISYRVLLQVVPSPTEWWIEAATGRLTFLRGYLYADPNPTTLPLLEAATLRGILEEALDHGVGQQVVDAVRAHDSDPDWVTKLGEESQKAMMQDGFGADLSPDARYLAGLLQALKEMGLFGGDPLEAARAATPRFGDNRQLFERVRARAALSVDGAAPVPAYEFSFGDWRETTLGGAFPWRMTFLAWDVAEATRGQRLTTRVITVREVEEIPPAEALKLEIPIGGIFLDRTGENPVMGNYRGENVAPGQSAP